MSRRAHPLFFEHAAPSRAVLSPQRLCAFMTRNVIGWALAEAVAWFGLSKAFNRGACVYLRYCTQVTVTLTGKKMEFYKNIYLNFQKIVAWAGNYGKP